MKESIYDRATKKIEQRITRVLGKIDAQFTDTKTYDTKVVPKRERLYNYLNMPPEEKEFARQSFGAAYNVYEQQMEKLKHEMGVTEDYYG